MNSTAGRIAVVVVGVALAVFLFAVLQDDGDSGDGGSETTATEATETQGQTETSPTKPPPEAVVMADGEVVGGVRTLTFTKGEQARILVSLDEPQEDVHIHGYDVEELNPPRGNLLLEFKADIEGIFELEAHGPSGDVLLAEIRVEPA